MGVTEWTMVYLLVGYAVMEPCLVKSRSVWANMIGWLLWPVFTIIRWIRTLKPFIEPVDENTVWREYEY